MDGAEFIIHAQMQLRAKNEWQISPDDSVLNEGTPVDTNKESIRIICAAEEKVDG
ncbi:hypothetical protein FACS189443_6950 [Planctomycetales bacterium]|nr:hypothetical protein FACS189443_6950 [Planctomycetales bacterium]